MYQRPKISILSDGNLWPGVLRFFPPTKAHSLVAAMQQEKPVSPYPFLSGRNLNFNINMESIPVARSLHFKNGRRRNKSSDPPGLRLNQVNHPSHPIALCDDDSVAVVPPPIVDLTISDSDMPITMLPIPPAPSNRKKGEELFPSPKEVVHVRCTNDLPITVVSTGDIRDFPFVYEFYDDNVKLPKQTTSFDEWLLKCCAMYIVWQGKQQIGLALHLHHFYFQMEASFIIERLRSYVQDPSFALNGQRFVCVGAAATCNDEFMFVRNMGGPFQDNIIPVHLLLSTISNTGGLSSDGTRQQYFTDMGYTSTRCLSRRSGCYLGLVRPRRYQATEIGGMMFNHTGKLFDAVSDATNMSSFVFDDKHGMEFAGNLGTDNKYEAIRIHKTFVNCAICTRMCTTAVTYRFDVYIGGRPYMNRMD